MEPFPPLQVRTPTLGLTHYHTLSVSPNQLQMQIDPIHSVTTPDNKCDKHHITTSQLLSTEVKSVWHDTHKRFDCAAANNG